MNKASFGILALLLASPAVHAQQAKIPRQVTLIISSAAGGGTDAYGRLAGKFQMVSDRSAV